MMQDQEAVRFHLENGLLLFSMLACPFVYTMKQSCQPIQLFF